VPVSCGNSCAPRRYARCQFLYVTWCDLIGLRWPIGKRRWHLVSCLSLRAPSELSLKRWLLNCSFLRQQQSSCRLGGSDDVGIPRFALADPGRAGGSYGRGYLGLMSRNLKRPLSFFRIFSSSITIKSSSSTTPFYFLLSISRYVIDYPNHRCYL